MGGKRFRSSKMLTGYVSIIAQHLYLFSLISNCSGTLHSSNDDVCVSVCITHVVSFTIFPKRDPPSDLDNITQVEREALSHASGRVH